MDDPEFCGVCNQPLRRLKHPVAHEGTFSWDAEVRTCPRNFHRAEHFGDLRHDEWHRCEGHGWTKREL